MISSFSQNAYLTILTHAPTQTVQLFADALLPDLGNIVVLQNRTGLVMLPYTDSAKGARFHLGEALVSEAHVRLEDGQEGYALCAGRDLLQALAIALLDAALQAGIQVEKVDAFIAEQQSAQKAADEKLLRQVEATRIEMETF